ncbi:MAG: hypothetical protein ABSC94_24415 [Polyangiaceae bacterium]|jgi:hypothetical protein
MVRRGDGHGLTVRDGLLVLRRSHAGWLLASLVASCTDTLNLGNDGPPTLDVPNAVVVGIDGTSVQVTARVAVAPGERASVEVTVPPGSGISVATFPQPVPPLGVNPQSWSWSFVADASASLGQPVQAIVTASVGAGEAHQTQKRIDIDAAVVATILPVVDATQGVGGQLQEYMSTAFQPADWQYAFFDQNPAASRLGLAELGAQHILIQLIDGGAAPWVADSKPPAITDWNFDKLNAIVYPVVESGDGQPELQIADVIGNIAAMTNSDGTINADGLLTYCVNLVKYYNTPEGFNWGPYVFRSDGKHRIPWWGFFGDFNAHAKNHLAMSVGQYAELYNYIVPQMLAVDPGIKISAFEFSVFAGDTTGDPTLAIGPFLADVDGGAPNVVSLHFFGTNTRAALDSEVFQAVPTFTGQLRDVVNVAADIPVRVTENNVNSDTPGDPEGFVNDERGTSAFFAAWRSYVFAELGKVGNTALYHWEHTAGRCAEPSSYCTVVSPPAFETRTTGAAQPLGTDLQNAEVDYTTGEKFISYWVDQWLGRMFPSPPSLPGPKILQQAIPWGSQTTLISASLLTTNAGVDVLATQNEDGSVVVMVTDLAPENEMVRDGVGSPRTTTVDIDQLLLSSVGPFASAFVVTIDRNTDLAVGPTPMGVPVATRIPVVLGGYGVAFLVLEKAIAEDASTSRRR